MKRLRAHDKLDEARFFLQHLREERRKTVRNRPEAFRYYLSAFLSAAVSVIQVLDHEAGDAFKEFWRRWRENLAQGVREFLNRMWDRRGAEVHELGPKVEVKEKPVPAELAPGVQIFGPPTMFLPEEHLKRMQELGLPPWTQAWTFIPELHFEGEGDALQVCERYLALLQGLLGDFTNPGLAGGEKRVRGG